MEYATGRRMALTKERLLKDVATVDIAQRVGYGSANAFSVGFTRHVGKPPAFRDRSRRMSWMPSAIRLIPQTLR